jgi:hypothetical protein
MLAAMMAHVSCVSIGGIAMGKISGRVVSRLIVVSFIGFAHDVGEGERK